MRDTIYRQIMERGFHPKREAFVQHYATDVLDASLLYMPLVGFIAPTDPMWQSTLRAMDEELVSDSLVYRYDPAASPDGLRGSEGTFTICTFWYVDALARSGRLDDARLTFEKMLTYSNHLGLYSEEIAPTGEQIGNFPQAFSHLAADQRGDEPRLPARPWRGLRRAGARARRRRQLTASRGAGWRFGSRNAMPMPITDITSMIVSDRANGLTTGQRRGDDDRAGQRDAERGSEIGDAARQAGDVALIPLRERRLHHVDRRGQHDPDAEPMSSSPGTKVQYAGVFADQRQEQTAMPTVVVMNPARISQRWVRRRASRPAAADDARMPSVAGDQHQAGLDRVQAPHLLQEHRDHEERTLQDQPLAAAASPGPGSTSGCGTAGSR